MTGTRLGLLPWLSWAICRMAEQAVCSLLCRVRAHMLASCWHAVLLLNLEHMKAAGLKLALYNQ